MISVRLIVGLFLAAFVALGAVVIPVLAGAPPVRIAIIPGGASGMEQEVCDRISDQLQGNASVALSTVNPDWYVVCNIVDKPDLVGQTIRVNGTVTIKTTDGHVLNTISAQTNKQDFNTNPGAPAPLNKALVDSAVREVIGGLSSRAINPILDAVEIEMATREKIIRAKTLGDDDKYEEALQLLMTISPDTPHFKGARSLIAEFQMELEAIELIRDAQANARKGRARQAIALLRAVSPKSKRYGVAKSMIANLNRPAKVIVKATPASKVSNVDAAQLKALDAQKKALEAQRKAIEVQEAAIKSKAKP